MESEVTPPESALIPDHLPVMVLSDCYLFPGCFLPLYIFEERYRQMLRHALAHDRMFCIGTRTGKKDSGEVLPWTTASLIRACVHQPDGTSHLMLYGLRRVAINGWEQEKPFRIAKVEPVPFKAAPPEQARELRERAIGLLPSPTQNCTEAMQKLRATLEAIPCADRVCDIMAYHFVRDPKALKSLLAEPDTARRYETLIAALRRL
jgi:Lon protease-like protein